MLIFFFFFIRSLRSRNSQQTLDLVWQRWIPKGLEQSGQSHFSLNYYLNHNVTVIFVQHIILSAVSANI